MSDKKFDDFDQYINTLPKEFEYTRFLLTQLFNEYKKELKYSEWFKKSNSDAVMKWWSEEEIALLLNREIATIEKVLKSNSLSKADKYVLQAVTEEDDVSMKYECQKLLNNSKDKKDNKASFAIPKWGHHKECAWGYEKFISNVNVNIRIYNKQKENKIYKVGGLPCTKGNIDGLSHEEYREREKSYYQKFKRICDKNNLGFEVDDYNHPQGEVHFDKDIGLCCSVTGEPHGDYTIFEDWEGLYIHVKEYFEGESK